MSSTVEIVVSALDLLGAAGFAYIALRLASLTLRIGGEPKASWAFSLLAAAQILASLAAISGGRLSYTAYVATASFSAAGFAMLTACRERQYALIPLALALPLGFDLLAAATAIVASMGFRGPARTLVAGIGVTFLVRTVGLVLLPGPTGEVLLAIGESLRSMGAAMLAVLYAAPQGR